MRTPFTCHFLPRKQLHGSTPVASFWCSFLNLVRVWWQPVLGNILRIRVECLPSADRLGASATPSAAPSASHLVRRRIEIGLHPVALHATSQWVSLVAVGFLLLMGLQVSMAVSRLLFHRSLARAIIASLSSGSHVTSQDEQRQVHCLDPTCQTPEVDVFL